MACSVNCGRQRRGLKERETDLSLTLIRRQLCSYAHESGRAEDDQSLNGPIGVIWPNRASPYALRASPELDARARVIRADGR